MVDTAEFSPCMEPDEAIGSSIALAQDFCLQPVGLGSERLREFILPKFPSPVVRKELVIGRTAVQPGEYRGFVSRQHISVAVEKGKIYVTSNSQPGCVHVNNAAIEVQTPVELQIGDTLCLLAPKQYFNYILVAVAHTEPELKKRRSESSRGATIGSAKRSKTALHAASSSAEGGADGVKDVAECAICLELMALSYSVVPCGHTFCYLCISDWNQQHQKCPTCSAEFSNIIPCRMLDDIIRATVITKNATDVAAFEQRYEDGAAAAKKKPAAVSAKPLRKKNKISSFFEVVDLS